MLFSLAADNLFILIPPRFKNWRNDNRLLKRVNEQAVGGGRRPCLASDLEFRIDKKALLANYCPMSYFDKKCPCGAPKYQVDGIILLFWLIGSVGIPLTLGADFYAVGALWLITPVIVAIGLLSWRKNDDIFFFGSFASVFLVLFGFAAKVIVGYF